MSQLDFLLAIFGEYIGLVGIYFAAAFLLASLLPIREWVREWPLGFVIIFILAVDVVLMHAFLPREIRFGEGAALVAGGFWLSFVALAAVSVRTWQGYTVWLRIMQNSPRRRGLIRARRRV